MSERRSAALRVSARVFILSRVLVFLVAVVAFQAFDEDRTSVLRFSHPEVSQPFGDAGESVVSVWARWDSDWYLRIANDGYDAHGESPAFFPVYPLVSRGAAEVVGLFSPGPQAVLIASVLVSLAAFALALFLLYRLTDLELGPGVASLAVTLLAFFPMAVFFSAVYTESLFLLFTVAAFWFARTERWALAGLVGAGAAATRSIGVLLVVPLLMMYVLGPRGPREQIRQRRGGDRYPLRPDALWLLLVPAGIAAYAAYMWAVSGDPLRFQDAQGFWDRDLGRIAGLPLGPVAGLWDGTKAAVEGAADIVASPRESTFWLTDGSESLIPAGVNLEAFAFMVFAIVATVGAFRRLPVAYGAWAALALAAPLAYPRDGYPLFSMPRFVAVAFPLFMWLGLAAQGRRWEKPLIGVFAVGLVLYTAQYATWQWVS